MDATSRGRYFSLSAPSTDVHLHSLLYEGRDRAGSEGNEGGDGILHHSSCSESDSDEDDEDKTHEWSLSPILSSMTARRRSGSHPYTSPPSPPSASSSSSPIYLSSGDGRNEGGRDGELTGRTSPLILPLPLVASERRVMPSAVYPGPTTVDWHALGLAPPPPRGSRARDRKRQRRYDEGQEQRTSYHSWCFGLVDLDVSFTSINDFSGMESLGRLQSLERLILDSCNVSDAGVRNLVRQLPGLRELNLADTVRV